MTSQVLGGRYEVQQQMGKRAGRRTFLARDLERQELVVVKLLSFGHDFEWDDLKLFEREAETLKSLSHPAIPRYLDYFELNSAEYKGFALVQTYVQGKSLEEHLSAGRTFSEVDLKAVAGDILQILAYLHERQPPVIHRDIKPSNILLTNRSGHSVGEVYLVDFGSVQTLAAKEGGTITVVGTYGYMPPEQFGGRATPASDLYSLGATLIYLATGRHPADLPQKDLRIQFEKFANLSPSLTNWLKWMTEPSLDNRLASAEQAREALIQEKSRNSALSDVFSQSAVVPKQFVVPQPVGSKVQLKKTVNSLEFIIPCQGFSWGAIGWLLLVIIPWILVCTVWTIGFFSAGINLWSASFLGLCWWFGIRWGLKIIFRLFGRIHIHFNQQVMTIAYELFRLKYKLSSVATENICKLVHTRRCSRPAKPMEYAPSHGYIQEEPKLIIWGGTKKYELCSEKLLTDPELDWLAQELGIWLKLGVSRD